MPVGYGKSSEAGAVFEASGDTLDVSYEYFGIGVPFRVSEQAGGPNYDWQTVFFYWVRTAT